MIVYPKQIERHILQELPFMATEKILMACVKKGKSRQEMHENIKKHSLEAGKTVKVEGKDNDLLQRLAVDDSIPYNLEELEAMIGRGHDFTGRAEKQTEEFIEEVVYPRLAEYGELLGGLDCKLNV